jgi:hypothetical protein
VHGREKERERELEERVDPGASRRTPPRPGGIVMECDTAELSVREKEREGERESIWTVLGGALRIAVTAWEERGGSQTEETGRDRYRVLNRYFTSFCGIWLQVAVTA